MKVQLDLQATHKVFEELRTYVLSEPDLVAFAPVALELETQARRLSEGMTEIPPLAAPIPDAVPSEVLAAHVIAIVSHLPAVGHDFDPASKLRLARLLTNLVDGITGTVFRDFPHLIPHDNP